MTGTLVVALATTLGTLADGGAAAFATAPPCQEYVQVNQSNSAGNIFGPGTSSLSPTEFPFDTVSDPTLNYITFGGVVRPRRVAEFRFYDSTNAMVKKYDTQPSDDGGVLRQDKNKIVFDFAQPGQKLRIEADFATRCGGDEVWWNAVNVGSLVRYPSDPVTTDPKYLVVGVIYGPPGAASTVEYANNTTLGARLSISSSFQSGVTQTTSVGTDKTSIGSETSFTQKTQDGASVTVEKSVSNAYSVPGPADSNEGIRHKYDRFLLWLNPRFTITATGPNKFVTGNYTNDPADPVSPLMDVAEVTVDQLQHPETLPPGTASRLQRSWSQTGALNATDFADILSRNPFANGNTAINPARFELIQDANLDYSPAPAGGQPTTRRYTLRMAAAINQSISSTFTVGTKVTGPESSVNFLIGKLKNQTAESFEFTTTTSLDFSEAQNQSVTLSLTGPPSTYQGPTALRAYMDILNGTVAFAFADVPTFQIGAPTTSQTVTQGGSAAYPITTQGDFGYNQPIAFSGTVTGLPAGATASFAPSSVTPGGGSMLTVTTTPQTPAGTYPLTITATSGLITRRLVVNLQVNPQPFTLTLSPSSRTVSSGGSAAYDVTVTAAAGFSGPVTLSGPGGLPAGATASFSPSVITGGSGTSRLNVTTSGTTPSGIYTLRANGTGGGITQTATAGLTVDNVQDFGISVTPQASGISAGDTAVYTVSTNGINGFAGNINLSVSGQPNGSTPAFTVNPIPGTGTSQLRIATTTSTQPADYDITITGTGAGKTHSQTVSLSVSPPVADTTPPAMTSSTPSAGAAGVPISSAITVQFSEPMAAATVTAANLEVRAGGSLVNRSVSYDAATNRATITPSLAMAGSTAYTVTVKGGASGVSDIAGNRMAADTSFTFTTEAVGGGGGQILGYDQIGALLDNGDMDYMNGSRFVTGSAGQTVTEARVYLRSVQAGPNNQYQMAIYTDSGGSPGTLVAKTAGGTLTPNSWNSLPISATLAPNTAYWLMYNTNGDNNVSYDTATPGSGAWSASNTPFGSWPATFGPRVLSDFKISIYVR